jgi:hypothetical protein
MTEEPKNQSSKIWQVLVAKMFRFEVYISFLLYLKMPQPRQIYAKSEADYFKCSEQGSVWVNTVMASIE